MEGRIEKHTLSSGQDIERRETYTATLFKREGGLFGTPVQVVPSCQIMIEQLQQGHKQLISYYFKSCLTSLTALTNLTNAKHTLV